ncbi:MAG: HTTM domain-containing protein [Myxococcota bacterium]
MTLGARLGRRVDAASLVAFRALLGGVLLLSVVRAWAYGWIDALYLQPAYHFAWLGVPVPPAAVLYGLFAAMGASAVAIAAGRAHRPACAVFLGAFAWVEALDKAYYLNHYVLVTLLVATLLAAPLSQRDLRASGFTAPGWALDLLRVEVALVYLWAGVWKLDPDWLLRAEPLTTWLRARVDVPVVGPWLAWGPTAYAMAWAGAAFDLAVPLALRIRATRAPAYAALVGFHLVLWALFPIGVFPWLMMAAATVLLSPSWPRALARMPAATPPAGRTLRRPAVAAWCAVVAALALVPARSALVGGRTAWHEVGFRFAWRVLLVEKTGYVEYRLEDRATGRRWRVSPAAELTPLQHQQLRTQPDLVAQYARHLAAREGGDVAVYADSWASLNGSPPQRLVRPDVDLSGPTPRDWRAWIVPFGALSALPAEGGG